MRLNLHGRNNTCHARCTRSSDGLSLSPRLLLSFRARQSRCPRRGNRRTRVLAAGQGTAAWQSVKPCSNDARQVTCNAAHRGSAPQHRDVSDPSLSLVRQCVRARPVLTAGACSVSHALVAHSQFAAVISYIPSSLCSTQFENGAFLTAQLTISCDDDSEHRAYWVAFSAVALVTYGARR